MSLRPRNRIIALWILIIFLSLTIGLSVVLGTYGKHYMDTSASDMKPITFGISPRFCMGVEVKSSDYPISVYMLPDKPVVKSGNLTSHVYQKYATLEEDKYEYWGYYLLEKSYVTISACSQKHGVDYYFIKGENNLNQWKDNNDCSSCYITHRSIVDCFYGNSTFTHTMYSSDEYYFVWTNHFDDDTCVTVVFDLKRTSYDLSSATHVCTHSFDCSLYYSGQDTDQSVVLALPDIDTDNAEISSTCFPRNVIFIGLFYIMPLGIGVSLTAIICICCIRKKTKTSSDPHRPLQNEPTNNTNTQYATFQPPPAQQFETNVPPPPYYGQSAPPSYEDALKPNKSITYKALKYVMQFHDIFDNNCSTAAMLRTAAPPYED